MELIVLKIKRNNPLLILKNYEWLVNYLHF